MSQAALPPRSAVVVSFLNEQAYLPRLLESLAGQTVQPDQLLLVDDGSSDDSRSVAARFTSEHAWGRIVRRPTRPVERDRLARAAELRAFHWGVTQLVRDWEVVVKLDADLDLPPDWLSAILDAFQSDPRLGVAGSYLSQTSSDGSLVREQHPDWHVRGPNKFYRRECFEQIEPLPEILGWDTIDDISARMHGWRTRSIPVPSRDPIHLRPTGEHDGRLRAFRRWGWCAWGYGGSLPYVVAGAAYRVRQRPVALASLNYVAGYVAAALRREPRAAPPIRRHFRREERQRLRRAVVARPGRPGG